MGGRASARKQGAVRAWVRGCVGANWIASKYLDWVALLLLPAKQTSPNGPVKPFDRLELGVRAGMLWSD